MAEAASPYTLADTWHLNDRVNLMLLDRLTDGQLACAANPRARAIGEQLAHLHAVRLAWLEAGGRRVAGMKKLGRGEAGRDALRAALEASGKALGERIAEAAKTGKMKGFKRGPAAFLGYLAAHEGHHRGQILLHLKQAGMAVDADVAYRIWEWGKI